MALSRRMRGLSRPSRSVCSLFCPAPSSRRLRSMSAFSSGVSHFASATRSSRKKNATTPISTVGMPSSRNSHCQPASPCAPPIDDMIQPDKGPPTTPDMGMPVRNSAVTLLRWLAGNQYVRYSRMAGMNPASATPSRKRMM
ncbi:hypothetical protein D9M68_593240 [compost metagenome]